MDVVASLFPERTVPVLPCRSIDEQAAFYAALGFETTFRRPGPTGYAAVRRGGIELHFFVLRSLEPGDSFSSCYVYVHDVDELYASFREGLRSALGRIPTRGIPRVGALRHTAYGVRQFTVTDPGGNVLRIGQPVGGVMASTTADDDPGSTLRRAIDAAFTLAASNADRALAARVLDRALASSADAPAALKVRARIVRAELAHATGDDDVAAHMLGEASKAPLNEDDRSAIADELERADDLRWALT